MRRSELKNALDYNEFCIQFIIELRVQNTCENWVETLLQEALARGTYGIQSTNQMEKSSTNNYYMRVEDYLLPRSTISLNCIPVPAIHGNVPLQTLWRMDFACKQN